MRLSSDSDLRWQPGVIGTKHTLNLKLGLTASEILTTDEPALELATRSAAIRAEIAAAFIDGHMPGIIAGTGEDTFVEGRLNTETATQWKARTAMWRGGDTGVSVDAAMDIAIQIDTSRPVTAIQALAAARSAVAGNVAECLVGKLKQELLGIGSTESTSTNRILNGKTAAYKARETGGGPLNN
jgi:hypothetical protein